MKVKTNGTIKLNWRKKFDDTLIRHAGKQTDGIAVTLQKTTHSINNYILRITENSEINK